MNSVDASIKIKQRLSKISSQDSRNIKDWMMEEATNKAMYDYLRRNLHGGNIYKEGDEETTSRVDDFQFLLKNKDLSVGNSGPYAETVFLPDDYSRHKRVTPNCSKDTCTGVTIRSTLIEEANIDEYLKDYNSQPSFDFEETFHTLIGNRVRVYHNNDFKIQDITLTYYRQPIKIQFVDPIHKTDTWEWKQSIAEQIVDEAVKILAGDIESLNENALADGRVEKNN